jgi:hypothetical protein
MATLLWLSLFSGDGFGVLIWGLSLASKLPQKIRRGFACGGLLAGDGGWGLIRTVVGIDGALFLGCAVAIDPLPA